jgi:cytoskeletal protein RodZ
VAQEESMAKGSFGGRLKRERELREVTLEEITSATRIGPRFLEALENEEWEKLPGGVFNRGFVRSVARYLGLDEEVLLGEYDLAHGAQLQSVAERPDNKRIPAVPKWFPVAILLGILVVLLVLIAGGIYAWRQYSASHATKQSFADPLRAADAKQLSEVATANSRTLLLELNKHAMSPRSQASPSVQ